MTIEVFAVCFNEVRMIPYFMRHYSKYGAVTIFDNESTDGSAELARSLGATVFSFSTNGEFREDILTHLRNDCWKDSKADWVIVCDIDEFVYHRNFLWALNNAWGTVLMPRMFQMYSTEFPTTKGQLYDEVRKGVEMKSKMCLFKPSQFQQMNYEMGCHHAYPEGNFILNVQTEIINLHFKNLSVDYALARNAELTARQSEVNRTRGWNWHIEAPEQETREEFVRVQSKLIDVIW